MNIYKRLLGYLAPYKVTLGFAFVVMILSSIADVMVSGVIYITTNGLMNRDYVMIQKIPMINEQLNIKFSVLWIPLIIVAVFLTKGVLSYISKYLVAVVGLSSVRDIQNDLYKHVSYLSLDYFSERHSGDVMSRITRDVYGVQNAITSIFLDIVKSPLTILFTVPIIFIMGGRVALISIAVFPLVAIPIVMLGKKLRKLSQRLLEIGADIVSFLQETILGIKIVKAFSAEEYETERFNEITMSNLRYSCKIVRAVELQRPIIEVMGAVGVAIAIFYAVKTLPLDRFVTFAGTLYLLYDPAKKLTKVNEVVQKTLASGVRIFELMDSKPSIIERKDAIEFKDDAEGIEFKDISFKYDDALVLRNINLSVNKGERVAFVGPSGAGKTTLVNMIPRFYDPSSGVITINNVDISSLTFKSLRSKLSIVSQEVILFSGTIRENIAYGKLEATDEEIEAAAKAANAHNFISELPLKYDTNIGIHGMKLSGGQRQRISIARAVLKNPQILIFDEATSQLDSESEQEVQKAIDNLMIGRTVFVIAHRLSTVMSADKIVVLENGVMVQSGTHAELLKQGGQYKKLHELQFK